MLKYRIMQPDELEACAKVAAEAFFDYDYFAFYVPDPEKRRIFLLRTLNIEMTINTRLVTYLVARQDDRIAAVATLCAPGHKKPSGLRYLRAGYWRQFLTAGFRNVSAWLDMEDRAGGPCRAFRGGNAWYLNMLTVDPACQGQGVGSAMLRDCVLPYARQRGGDCLTLFTNSQENRLFYQKNGFTEFDERSFSFDGHTLGSWSYRIDLQREP